MKLSYVILTALWVCVGQVSAQITKWTYKGFAVSGTAESLDESMQRAVADQINMVCTIGLRSEFIDFFRAVPISVVPGVGILSGNPGLYIKRDRAIRLTSRMASIGHKPVLLHELLHAYHDQKMSSGFGNHEVLKLYESAKHDGIFNPKSHMMQNPMEYFACASTTFLFGVTVQEPFHRESLNKQSDLVKFLRGLFGSTCGGYEGSISSYRPNQSLEPNGQASRLVLRAAQAAPPGRVAHLER